MDYTFQLIIKIWLLNGYYRKFYIIIGAAHNQKEIDLKLNKVVKKLFFQDFLKHNIKIKKGFLGIQKFNIISLRTRVELVPLGGINEKNLNKMNTVRSNSFACLSAIKKKPAKIINRLF